jgi:hypothetical protein
MPPASKTAAMLRVAVFPAKTANPCLGGGLRGHLQVVARFIEDRRQPEVGGLHRSGGQAGRVA